MNIFNPIKTLSLSLIIILTSCTEPPSQPIKIALQSVWPSFGAAFIAQEQGFFTQYGVNVTLVSFPDYLESLALYKKGEVDAGFMTFVDALMAEAEGISSRVIYATDYSETGNLILGQPHLKNLSDLKGKTVSFEGFNTFSHFFVVKLLEKSGLHEGEFRTANLSAAEALSALETGQIDAAHFCCEQAISQALAKGYKILAKAGDIFPLTLDVLIVNSQITKTRPKEVQGIVNALVKAMEFLRHAPKQGFPLVAKFTKLTEGELKASFNRLRTLNLRENQEIFQERGSLWRAGQEIIDFFYQKGILVKIPDLNQVIENRWVESVEHSP